RARTSRRCRGSEARNAPAATSPNPPPPPPSSRSSPSKGGLAATTVLITTPPPSLPRNRSRPSLVVSGELLRPTDTTILSRHPDNRQSTQQLWITTTSHGGTTPESTGMRARDAFSPPHQRVIHNAPDTAGSHRLRTRPGRRDPPPIRDRDAGCRLSPGTASARW